MGKIDEPVMGARGNLIMECSVLLCRGRGEGRVEAGGDLELGVVDRKGRCKEMKCMEVNR